MASAAVSDEGALRMRPTPCGCTSALFRLAPDCLFCGDTVAVASQTHFFCLARKSGQKETLEANRILPQATEGARRRTLRPAHKNLSANLYYSAACVETTLPSIAVATQGAGKTPCRGNRSASTHSPVVHNFCVLLQMFVGADAYIGPYRPVSNIGTNSYRESYSFAPE